jgi:hypothetical protein
VRKKVADSGKGTKTTRRGGAWVIRSAEGNRSALHGSKSKKSTTIREAIRSGHTRSTA